VLSETFTISGWDIRLCDMKRTVNRLALLGVTFLQYMGAAYDFVPAENSEGMTNGWQNPLYRHYSGLTRYISALQWFVANTTSDAHTLLLYPMTTVRAELQELNFRRRDDSDWNLTINGLVNGLLNLQIPFEFGFEQVIDAAQVRDGTLIADGMVCNTVILPGTTCLRETTFEKLRQFAASGGRIVCVNGKPETIIGDRAFPAPELEHAIVYDCRNYEITGSFVNNNDYYQQAPMGEFTRRLQQALDGIPAPVVAVDPCDGILSDIRCGGEAIYAMIINDENRIMTVSGTVHVDLPFAAIDVQTGENRPMKTSGRRFELELAPYGCVIVEVSRNAKAAANAPETGAKTALPLEHVAFRPDGLNTAVPELHQVRGRAAEEIIAAAQYRNPARVCELAQALTASDIVSCRSKESRYIPAKSKRDWFGWIPQDNAPLNPGDTTVCIYDFTIDGLPETLQMVCDPMPGAQWYLNGKRLFQTGAARVWHFANPTFDLSGIVRCGANRLVCVCTYPLYGPALLPCAVLKGDFRVFGDFVLTQKPGAHGLDYWCNLGYRCHTGDGIYTMDFAAPESGRVLLELDTKDVAEVFVNGVSVAKQLWAPYRTDLTEAVKPGRNVLEIRVTGTLANFLYSADPSGLAGAALYHIPD